MSPSGAHEERQTPIFSSEHFSSPTDSGSQHRAKPPQSAAPLQQIHGTSISALNERADHPIKTTQPNRTSGTRDFIATAGANDVPPRSVALSRVRWCDLLFHVHVAAQS